MKHTRDPYLNYYDKIIARLEAELAVLKNIRRSEELDGIIERSNHTLSLTELINGPLDGRLPTMEECEIEALRAELAALNYTIEVSLDTPNTIPAKAMWKRKRNRSDAPLFYYRNCEQDGSSSERSWQFMKVTGYNGEDGDLCEIPDEIDRCPVTAIGDYAFKNRNIRSFKLPKDLYVIRDGAFEGCRRLKSIELPKSLRYINFCAFMDTPIKTLIIPAGVSVVHNLTFNMDIGVPAKITCVFKGRNTDIGSVYSLHKTEVFPGVKLIYCPHGSRAEARAQDMNIPYRPLCEWDGA